MRAALGGLDDADADALTAAALARLRAALDLGDSRAAAYELLTADALLTAAAAAAADRASPATLAAAEFAALLETP
jgi:hypothetical protein